MAPLDTKRSWFSIIFVEITVGIFLLLFCPVSPWNWKKNWFSIFSFQLLLCNWKVLPDMSECIQLSIFVNFEAFWLSKCKISLIGISDRIHIPKLQYRLRFETDWHYSVKQWLSLVPTESLLFQNFYELEYLLKIRGSKNTNFEFLFLMW